MKILLKSTVKPGAQGWAPRSVTLSRWEQGGYVVHIHNEQDGGFYNGRYYKREEWNEALAVFADESKRLGVEPDWTFKSNA